ncbi:MAG: recombinase RecF [Rubrivivax sp.]|nr:recombinase RecF [Rubrivivax sp.]
MRIDSILVTDFLGVRVVDARALRPVTIIGGRNRAGKSSVRDAVTLALTGALGRVGLKKEAGQLVRAGASGALCQVVDADGDQHQVMIKASGTITGGPAKGREPDPALQFVLDGQRFAALPPVERRAFLFGIMGVKADPGDIARRLEARGCHIGKVQRVLTLLRAGMDAAADEAKRQASEARGAWRNVTGEAYGSEKAKGWRATVPPYAAAEHKRLATAIQAADVAIAKWQQEVGAMQAEEQRRQKLRGELPALAEHAARVPRIETKLAADEASMQAAEQELARVSAAAGAGPRVGLVHDLAMALHRVAMDDRVAALIDLGGVDEVLTCYELEHGRIDATDGDPAAQARLPAVRDSLAMLQRAVANDRRDLAAAQQAKAEHDRITAELAEVFDVAALAEAREHVEKITAARTADQKALDALSSAKAAADAAEAKTAQAAEHAKDVAAWELIAEQLSPDGIPADLLREALGPIHERLHQHAADTGWPQVRIHEDMRITAGERDYRLLSESERWRTDAMLAEAIAHLSGHRLLLLDRMDVLDLPARGELLGWLDTLAELGEIDTALVFATLKAPPAAGALPPHVGALWIDNGHHATQPEKEAA